MGVNPAASAAAEPPLEPPGDFSVFHGFRVAPYTLFEVNAVAPNSGLFVLPMMIAPASRSRDTTESSTSSVGPSAYSADPDVVTWPYTRAMSFTKNGKPARAPVRGCDAASARASSANVATTAFNDEAASIRRRLSFTRSTGLISPDRTLADSSSSISED